MFGFKNFCIGLVIFSLFFTLISSQLVYQEMIFPEETSCDSRDPKDQIGTVYYHLDTCYPIKDPGCCLVSDCDDLKAQCLSNGPLHFPEYQNCSGRTAPSVPTIHIKFTRHQDFFYQQLYIGDSNICNGSFSNNKMSFGNDFSCGTFGNCFKYYSSQPKKVYAQQYQDSVESCSVPENTTSSFAYIQEECNSIYKYDTEPSCDQVEMCLNGSEYQEYHQCLNVSATIEGSFRVFQNGSAYFKSTFVSTDCSGAPVISLLEDSCSASSFPGINHPSCGFSRTQHFPSFIQTQNDSQGTSSSSSESDSSQNSNLSLVLGSTFGALGALGGLVVIGCGCLLLLLCCGCVILVMVILIGTLILGVGVSASGASVGVMKAKSSSEPLLDFTLGKKLGEGSFGQVFQATASDGTEIAVKRLLLDDMEQESFQREVEMLQTLGTDFPYMVKYLGMVLDQPNRLAYLKMELCDGTLEQHLSTMTLDQKLGVMAKVASALSLMHSQGIVHRDLALRNILFKDGQPKLSDFGMSRTTEDDSGKTVSSMIPIRWTAAEAMRNKDGVLQFSKASDIYSLGMTFYEILSGQKPFYQWDVAEAGRMIQQGLIPELTVKVPEQFLQLYQCCLSYNPNDRPTAVEVISILREITSIPLSMGEYVSFSG